MFGNSLSSDQPPSSPRDTLISLTWPALWTEPHSELWVTAEPFPQEKGKETLFSLTFLPLLPDCLSAPHISAAYKWARVSRVIIWVQILTLLLSHLYNRGNKKTRLIGFLWGRLRSSIQKYLLSFYWMLAPVLCTLKMQTSFLPIKGDIY